MSRTDLPRAYLRVDPNIDQVYPELRNTFVGLMCSAHRQPERGRYRDRRLVEALHSRAFVRASFDRGDLVTLPDGRIYLDGWDEWQEGDLTVAERMRRMRNRRKRKRDGSVTVEASPERFGVTTDAYVVVNESLEGVGVGVGVGAKRAQGALHHVTRSIEAAWVEACGRSLLSSGEFAIGIIDDAARRHPEPDVIAGIAEARRPFVRIPEARSLASAVRSLLDPLPASSPKPAGGHTRPAAEVEAAFNRG